MRATVLPDGRWLLYKSDQHAAITLSAAAGILWELCDGQSSVDSLVAQLQEYYPDTPQAELEAATRTALHDFLAQGLIADDEPPPTGP